MRRTARVRGLFSAWLTMGVLAIAAAGASAQTPDEILSHRPLASTDHSAFSPQVYPETPPLAPAGGPVLTDAQARSALQAYEQAENPTDTSAQEAALAAFDDPALSSKVPNPSLRAALAALRGTFADAAIDFVESATVNGDPKVTGAQFVPSSQLSSPNLAAEVHVDATGQMQVRWNDRYASENPFLLTQYWAHELLHEDTAVHNTEEAIAQSFNQLLYLRQLARHPELAATGTEFSRLVNSQAYARLNSGTGSALGLFATNADRQLLPGSALEATSWAQIFLNTDTAESPGNALLGSYLASTHNPKTPGCAATVFDAALLDCIDANGSDGLTSDELIAAARALRLDTAAQDGAACDQAKAKLQHAKEKLKQLKHRHASKKAIAKAKKKVKEARAEVDAACV